MSDQRLGVILWRGKWLILLSLAVGVILAVVVTKTSAKVYSAQTTIQVDSGAGSSGTAINPADIVTANQGLASTYAALITDRSFLQQIRPHVLGGRLSTTELADRISASAIQNTSLVQVNAQGPTPAEARLLAGEVSRQFVDEVRGNSQQQTNELQTQIQARISALDQQITAGGSPEALSSLRGARAELEKQLAQIVAGQIAQGASVRLTAPATASPAPIRPRPLLNVIAGALLGLLVGLGLALLRLRLDRGLHGSSEAEELVNAPLLASIPIRRRHSADDPVLGEAYDVLRANLAFLALDTPMNVLTFSSFNPREGKSSTVEGLAYAAVRGGLSVVLVDADVRTRTLSSRVGREDEPGLTNVVIGMSTLDDVLVDLAPGLSLLPAGPTPPNPPSLLSSGQMRDVVDDLRSRYSLVLLDSPPVAHLADASILAAASDGVVVVARVGVTARADLPRVVANLRHSPTPVVGVVVLEPRTVDQTYYPSMAKGKSAPAVRDSAVAS